MDEKTKNLVLGSFAEYYKIAEFNIPSLEKREFGVGFRKKIDARHLSFDSVDQLRNYLLNNTPFYISYSTAHYEKPEITPIDKKGWLGADLIFDLDIHSEGKYGVYLNLEKTKNDAVKIFEEFLEPDFGISKKDILYVFSGNRGYHVHVRSKDVFELGSNERREIVDYIRGVGLDFKEFFEKDIRGKIHGPRTNAHGYRGRFVKKVLEILNEKPSKIYRGFSDPNKKMNFIEGLNEGNWSRIPFSFEKLQEKLTFIAQELPLSSVDADAAVTYDVKKLIRMPNSIHGDTGFIAKEIKNMDSFEPLKDAIIDYKKTLKIKFIEDVPELHLLNETYSFNKGEEKELPLSLALFYILKESAAIQ